MGRFFFVCLLLSVCVGPVGAPVFILLTFDVWFVMMRQMMTSEMHDSKLPHILILGMQLKVVADLAIQKRVLYGFQLLRGFQ